MLRVGTSIREKFNWIPIQQKCYLIMDNAGGYDTSETVEWYKNELLTKFNIDIIHQIPRSPFTNVLNLGIWMSLQSIVERRHFLKRCSVSVLERTVMTTWNSSDLNQQMANFFERLKVVLCNILKGNGGNDLVEENRELKGRAIKIESTNSYR